MDFIDIASYQKGLNPTVPFICKATEGIGFKDKVFDTWKNHPLCMGYYHFARHDLNNDPEEEAGYFVATTGVDKSKLYILDYETRGTGSLQWCLAFLKTVGKLTRTRPIIYMSSSWALANWGEVEDYPLWVAEYKDRSGQYKRSYNTNLTWKGGVWAHQYSSAGKLDGWNGNLDFNKFVTPVTQNTMDYTKNSNPIFKRVQTNTSIR